MGDLALYILISMTLMIVVIVAARNGVSDQAFNVWLGTFFSGLLLFGVFIPAFRRLWNEWRFWVLIVVMLAFHIEGWKLLVSRTHLRSMQMAYVIMPEGMILAVACDWVDRLVRRLHAKRREREKSHIPVPR